MRAKINFDLNDALLNRYYNVFFIAQDIFNYLYIYIYQYSYSALVIIFLPACLSRFISLVQAYCK